MLRIKAVQWLYKWLPIIMGCHCRADRSFSYKGRPFPICARCTGELAGFLLAIILFFFIRLRFYWLLLMILPAVLDGLIQMYTAYESNNLRRLWTGLFLGYGGMSLLLLSFSAAFNLGIDIGNKYFVH